MPIYEFYCANCDTRFERLLPMKGDGHSARCARCEGTASRVLSLFASFAKVEGGDSVALPGGGGCSACAGGSCACGQGH